MWGIEEAKIKVALHELYMAHQKCVAGLSATISPTKFRQLEATKKFNKDEIVLVPLTTTIALKKVEDDIASGSVLLKEYKSPKGATFNVVLSPGGGIRFPKEDFVTGIGGLVEKPQKLLCPFWLVKEASVDGDANLVAKRLTCATFPQLQIPVLTNKKVVDVGDVLVSPHCALAPKLTSSNKEQPKKKIKRS